MDGKIPDNNEDLNLNEIRNKFSLKSENEDNIINENYINKPSDSNKIKVNSKYKIKYNEIIAKCSHRKGKKYMNDNEFFSNLLLMTSVIDVQSECSIFSILSNCYISSHNEHIYSLCNKIEKYINEIGKIDRINFIKVLFRAAYFFQMEKNYFYALKYVKKTESLLDSSIHIDIVTETSKYLAEMANDFDNYINDKKKKIENEMNDKICDKIIDIIQSLFVNNNNIIGNTQDNNNNKYFYVISKIWLVKAMSFLVPFKTIMKDDNEKKNFFDVAFENNYVFENYFDEDEKVKGVLKKYPPYPGPINNYPIKDFKDYWEDSINLDENDFIKKGLTIENDYIFINSCDWEFLKSFFDCTNEIKRTVKYTDLIKLKFILFDRRISKYNNNMNLLKQKYIQINKNSTIRQLKDKILISINQVLNSEINNEQEISFYLLNKENKDILIEMVSAFYQEIQMYESLYIEKIEFQDDNTLNDFFLKYDKKKHILILEVIQKGEMNYLIQLDKNYKCSECNKIIFNLDEKYNCDYCHFSLFCSPGCSSNSYDHGKIDSFLRELMESTFNLSEFLPRELKSILSHHSIRGNIGFTNSETIGCLNSVFQSLSHTEDLTKYFLMECHKEEANKNDFDSKDSFLYRYYKFIDCIWNSSGFSYHDGYGDEAENGVFKINDFATYICSINPIKDNNQDAFEFLSFLLRRFHEELKRPTNMKKNKLEEQTEDENDEIASKRYWDYYKGLDDSIICDLFTGLFKCTYTCSCGKKTFKYDKLKYLELPIPTKKTSSDNIQFKLFTQNGNFIDINMKVDDTTEMKDLILKSISYLKNKKDKSEEKNYLVNIQKIKMNDNLINYNIKFVPDFVLYNSIKVIEFAKSLTMINIYEPSYENAFNKKSGNNLPFDKQNYKKFKNKDSELIFFETDLKSNLENYIDVYIYPVTESEKEGLFFNKVKQKKIVSFPIIISIEKYKTLNQMREIIQEKVRKMFHEQAQNITNAIEICYPHFNDKMKNFKIKEGKCPICGKKIDSNQWCSLFDPFYMNMTIHKFMNEINKNRPLILYAQSSFYKNGYSLYRGMKLFDRKCELDLRNNLSLYDALELMKNEKEIVKGELCKKCNGKGKIEKNIEIYKAPYYLIIKIKRFKQNQKSVVKNETFIDYKEVLNLEDFVVGPDKKECIYDLYAVINHRKFMNKIYYSAFCKNLGLWFLCDDRDYKLIDNIVSKEAYILFYKKRSI